MTKEEACALDKKGTETTPKAGPNGSGFIAKHKAAQNIAPVIAVDGPTYGYLFAKVIAVQNPRLNYPRHGSGTDCRHD
jgi:hypothetical protein